MTIVNLGRRKIGGGGWQRATSKGHIFPLEYKMMIMMITNNNDNDNKDQGHDDDFDQGHGDHCDNIRLSAG